MKFIDLHCDTLMLSFKSGQEDIYEMPGMLDIKRMKESGALAQFLAIFMPPPGAEKFMNRSEPFKDEEYLAHCFKAYRATLAAHGDILAPGTTGTSIEKNEEAGKMTVFLTFEDGRPVAGSLENLEKYHGLGIRLISLTWNGENCFGFPNSKEPETMQKGLKPFGKDAIRRMNELGMVVDVSHLSDGGFWDVAELSKKPFVASHSNCRALSPHQRNLCDEMIRAIAEKGGVAGLNFGPAVLNSDTTVKDSTAALLSAHARHMIDVGGIGCVALGSDFDGIHGNLEISGVEKMHLLFDQFRRDGLSEGDVEKIAWKNSQRVLKDILG
jgi:membrane dipeptidase